MKVVFRRFRRMLGHAKLSLKRILADALRAVSERVFSKWSEKQVQSALAPLLAVWGVRALVTHVVSRMLRISNRRYGQAAWLRFCFERRPSSFRTGRAAALAALGVREYGEVSDICKRLKHLLAGYQAEGQLPDVLEIELMAALDQETEGPEVDVLCRSQGTLINFFYERAWQAHTMRWGHGVKRSLRIYLSAVDFAPDLVEHVINQLYKPNGLWAEILWAADSAISATERRLKMGESKRQSESKRRIRSVDQEQLDRFNGILLEAAAHAGDKELVHEVLKRGWKADPTFLFYRSMYEEAQGEPERAIQSLQEFLAIKNGSNSEKALAYGMLGMFHEECRHFEVARLYYSESYRCGGVPFWFPEYLWRYLSQLMAVGEWNEAIYVKRQGLLLLWREFASLAKIPIQKRLRTGEFVPRSGAFILGCQGVGDDIMRLAIFQELRNPSARYAFSCDRRLIELLSNAIPGMEFVSNSTVNGKHKASMRTYMEDREGVPPYLDPARITNQVLKKIRQYPDIALSEDMQFAFVAQRGKFRRQNLQPTLIASTEVRERMSRLVAQLPAGRLNVGISWRSGHRDPFRDKAYTSLPEWGDIFRIPNVNFVNLQYQFEQDELDEVQELFGIRIHTLPGVDLKDDLHEVAAICGLLDAVITPGTALREIAGGVGANTYSISSTRYFPDLYRIDEDGNDVIFPSMQHVTAYSHGDAGGVLAEIGRRIREKALAHIRESEVA